MRSGCSWPCSSGWAPRPRRSRPSRRFGPSRHGRDSNMTEPRTEIGRTVLNVLAILALIVASFWILRPFLGAMVWATTIVVATWPLLLRLQRTLWGKRALAVTL